MAASIIICASAPALGQDAAQALQQELRAIAERSSAAVVAIQSQGLGGSENPFDAHSRASGFIVSTDGHILTDARAVRGRRRFDVRLRGGLRGSARLVGTDTLNSVAVLQLDDPGKLAERLGGRLPALALGTSSDLRLGQSVFTITNAFDSLITDGTPSFSWGNVTSIGRVREGAYRGVAIEVDAAVNPGSFGAPLLDRAGRVVGLVSVSFSTSRWLGMAIPADQVRLGVEDIIAGRSLTQGFLGLSVRSSGGEANPDGVEVVRVVDGSPAATAGLQPGDRVVAVDGSRMLDSDDLARELMPLAPGSRVVLRVKRGESAREVRVLLARGEAPVVVQRPAETVRPAARPPVAQPPRQETPAPAQAPRVTLGVRTTNRDGGGVRIVEVVAEGPAAKGGIVAGDVIVAVAKEKVASLIDLRRLLDARKPGDSVVLTVERDGWSADRTVLLSGVAGAETKAPGYLGVYLRSGATPVEIERVEAGSPAAKAGLRAGDVILGVEGRLIATPEDFAQALAGRGAGDALAFAIRRGAARYDWRLVLAPRPSTLPPPPAAGATPPAAAPRAWFGAALALKAGKLVADEVDPKGPAAAAGLKTGDAILQANGRAVRTLADFEAVFLPLAAGARLRLEVERDGWTKSVEVLLTARP